MAQYIAAYKGYIADVPRVWFKRCDGHLFYFDEITQASATPNMQTTEINAGWQLFPVAVLPGQQTMEISLTSGQFNTELFALAANRHFAEEDYNAWFTETVTFTAGTATLSYAPVANTFWFNGLDANDTVVVNNKTVTVTLVSGPLSPEAHQTLVDGGASNIGGEYAEEGNTFSGALTGDVEVMYQVAVSNDGKANVLYSTNAESVIGEAFLRWPVYSANDDCADSAIKGYIELHVFRCRVTQGPGFDTSYKTAQTNQITLSTVDAKRADEAAYSIAYFELPLVESQQAG